VIRHRSLVVTAGAVVTVMMAVTMTGMIAGCSSDPASTLPDVDIERLDGSETISLADLDGPAVVNLWATWCAPCRREIPAFEAVHRARSDEVRFVGVNVGEDVDVAAEYLAEVGATYDQFSDSEGYVVTELDTTAMPVTIVIDADGAITRRELGPMDIDDLDEAIDEAIAASS
jgi:thiol-disulfide isomerase/thioredoxin